MIVNLINRITDETSGEVSYTLCGKTQIENFIERNRVKQLGDGQSLDTNGTFRSYEDLKKGQFIEFDEIKYEIVDSQKTSAFIKLYTIRRVL